MGAGTFVFHFHIYSALGIVQIAHIPGCFLDSLLSLSLSPEKARSSSQKYSPAPTVGFSYRELFMDHTFKTHLLKQIIVLH